MSSRAKIKKQQRKWATRAGIRFDDLGYVRTVNENLFQPMSTRTYCAISKGSGSELRDTKNRPAKMKALHSSAALHVNMFDYWSERILDPLLHSLMLHFEPAIMEFEAPFPTGISRPHLDVAFRFESGLVVGIESKFLEWLTPISPGKELFKPSYFSNSTELWSNNNVPSCQALATSLYTGTSHFRNLDAAQLLKHALGLATQHPHSFELYYLYFDCLGSESSIHDKEVEEFERHIGSDFRFHHCSYQEAYERLRQVVGVEHAVYIDYLRQRYLPLALVK